MGFLVITFALAYIGTVFWTLYVMWRAGDAAKAHQEEVYRTEYRKWVGNFKNRLFIYRLSLLKW
jgi:hypothetical protein